MEREQCRKVNFLQDLPWACSEELYDCHLIKMVRYRGIEE